MRIGLLDAQGYVVNIMEWPDETPVPEEWGGRATYAEPCAVGGRVVDGVYAPPVEPPAPEPERRSVRKLLIVDRLIAAELADAAAAGFAQNPILQLRFFSAQDVWSDDADAITFLTAIGANPDEILAPE